MKWCEAPRRTAPYVPVDELRPLRTLEHSFELRPCSPAPEIDYKANSYLLLAFIFLSETAFMSEIESSLETQEWVDGSSAIRRNWCGAEAIVDGYRIGPAAKIDSLPEDAARIGKG